MQVKPGSVMKETTVCTGARVPSPSTIFSEAAGKPEGMQEGRLTIYLIERRLGDF